MDHRKVALRPCKGLARLHHHKLTDTKYELLRRALLGEMSPGVPSSFREHREICSHIGYWRPLQPWSVWAQPLLSLTSYIDVVLMRLVVEAS